MLISHGKQIIDIRDRAGLKLLSLDGFAWKCEVVLHIQREKLFYDIIYFLNQMTKSITL